MCCSLPLPAVWTLITGLFQWALIPTPGSLLLARLMYIIYIRYLLPCGWLRYTGPWSAAGWLWLKKHFRLKFFSFFINFGSSFQKAGPWFVACRLSPVPCLRACSFLAPAGFLFELFVVAEIYSHCLWRRAFGRVPLWYKLRARLLRFDMSRRFLFLRLSRGRGLGK